MLRRLSILAVAICVLPLAGCITLLTRTATEPTSGPRARIRVIGSGGDLLVTPERQPDGKRGSMIAHGFLWPGTRSRIGMPDGEDATKWADEYYVMADQDIVVTYDFRVDTPGTQYGPGTSQRCGPIDAKFHVAADEDYEVSAAVGPTRCLIVVTRLIAVDGRVTLKVPVPLKPRFP